MLIDEKNKKIIKIMILNKLRYSSTLVKAAPTLTEAE